MHKIIFIVLITFFAALQAFANDTEPELLPANKTTLDSIIEANKGKVILFNFWAYWCQPCKEEFPDLMKLKKDYEGKDFKLVFVTLDFDDALATKTRPFLAEQQVDFTTYYNAFKKDEDLINYMTPEGWDGGIPATFIYDKNGTQTGKFIGKKTYEDFKTAVEDAMSK